MKYAIETLQKQLDFISQPIENDIEEDYIDAIIYSRNSQDIKLALKVLNEFMANSKIFKFIENNKPH